MCDNVDLQDIELLRRWTKSWLWINEKRLPGDIIERIIYGKSKQLHSDLYIMCICCLTVPICVLFRVLKLINSFCIISNDENCFGL